jgi:hypothetical protein
VSYADDARSAYNDIRSSGGPIIITREGTVVVNESEDSQTPGIPEAYPHWALILSAPLGGGDTFESGSRVRNNSRKLIVPSFKLDIVPVSGDKVVFEGFEWEIKSVDPLAPHGGKAIIYTVMVTR